MTTNPPTTDTTDGAVQERMPLSDNNVRISLNVLSEQMSGSFYHWHVARLSRHIDAQQRELAASREREERLRSAMSDVVAQRVGVDNPRPGRNGGPAMTTNERTSREEAERLLDLYGEYLQDSEDAFIRICRDYIALLDEVEQYQARIADAVARMARLESIALDIRAGGDEYINAEYVAGAIHRARAALDSAGDAGREGE